ncbi:MAG: universal stress protein, partial [Actinomycetota bacterium]|nr:universal stress protein [Actinomycetota bacterium]
MSVGSRGRRGVCSILLGSVSHAVLPAARCAGATHRDGAAAAATAPPRCRDARGQLVDSMSCMRSISSVCVDSICFASSIA